MDFQRCDNVQITDWKTFLNQSALSFQANWRKNEEAPLCRKDFHSITTLGKGGYGRVECALRNGTYYAIKIIPKTKCLKNNLHRHIMYERRALQAVNFPFIVSLDFYFSDKRNLYFVMPYVSGGDFFQFLRKVTKLPEHASRFYASQIVLALEYLHYMQVVYRDLKPENVLLERDGYVKLADLGFCKMIKARTYTFCGTAEYVAPEILLNKGHGLAVDWWSLGIFIYEMVAGFTPFCGKDEETILRNISNCDYTMCPEFSIGLKDLIGQLLKPDPTQRLGNLRNGANDVKNQHWFQGVDWLHLLNKSVSPPYVPQFRRSESFLVSSDDSSGSGKL